MTFPSSVKIVEVGPRDGLQNENNIIATDIKIQLIEMLTKANLKNIESGSFVNPKWIPQMADSEEIFTNIIRQKDVSYSGLTPNIQGYDRAMSVNVDEVAIFGAASEAFTQKNINCSIDESLDRFKAVMEKAHLDNTPVRAYLSCVVCCPYEGPVTPFKVLEVAEKLLDMGCYEISLGDTIGVATPADVKKLLDTLLKRIPPEKLAVHFHNTYGQALTNIYTSLKYGISAVDSSVAGLGGCPYAKGASGNVATEDVIYMLDGLSIETGVDLDKLVAAGNMISEVIGRENGSYVARAMNNKV